MAPSFVKVGNDAASETGAEMIPTCCLENLAILHVLDGRGAGRGGTEEGRKGEDVKLNNFDCI